MKVAAAILVATLAWGPSPSASLEAPATKPLAGPAFPIAPPSYFKPLVFEGKVFPVARSNHLSLLSFGNDWHAPRLRFVDGRWQLIGVHEGVDITAERGTPILSMTPGVVENVGWTFYSGDRVGIRGDDGRYYFYAHLSDTGPGIVPGARVEAGTLLGLVGNTGYGPPGHRDEFPPHLHFGIEEGDTWVSPYPALASLYEATVAANEDGRAQLDALAAAGDAAGWEQAAASLYTDFGL